MHVVSSPTQVTFVMKLSGGGAGANVLRTALGWWAAAHPGSPEMPGG